MRVIFCALVMLGVCKFAGADVLDFENLNLNDGDPIPQTYGDTTNVDVEYQIGFFNKDTVVLDDLHFSGDSHGNLGNYVFTQVFDGGNFFAGVINFNGLGNLITLDSFDVGAQDPFEADGSFRVYDGDGQLLYENLSVTIDAGTNLTLNPAVSAETLVLKWTALDSPNKLGIDNIVLSTTPVPEPSCSLMMLLGLYFVKRTRAN